MHLHTAEHDHKSPQRSTLQGTLVWCEHCMSQDTTGFCMGKYICSETSLTGHPGREVDAQHAQGGGTRFCSIPGPWGKGASGHPRRGGGVGRCGYLTAERTPPHHCPLPPVPSDNTYLRQNVSMTTTKSHPISHNSCATSGIKDNISLVEVKELSVDLDILLLNDPPPIINAWVGRILSRQIVPLFLVY